MRLANSFLVTLEARAIQARSPIVLVTHHVEQIPEGITRVLLLRVGHQLAAGPIDEVLT